MLWMKQICIELGTYATKSKKQETAKTKARKLNNEKDNPQLLHPYANACLVHKIFVTRGKKLSGW